MMPMMKAVKVIRRTAWRGLVLLMAAMVLASCGWRGIANVPLPGGPGTGANKMTIYVQMPDTLALNVNSRVRVADVIRRLGAQDRAEELGRHADARHGRRREAAGERDRARSARPACWAASTSSSAAPPNPSPQPLKNGDIIPLKNSSSYPTIERTLASIATVLHGGGIPNLEVIQTEVNNILDGHADQIREFLEQLDTFTAELNQQRDDITRAIDSTNQLLTIVAKRNDTLDRVLTEFPPLIKHFADTRDLFADAVEALGRFSKAADAALSAPRARTCAQNLQKLQRPLKQLGRASPYWSGR